MTPKEWTEKNRERSNEIKRAYVKRHPDRVKASKRKWSKANAGKEAAKCRMYQAAKLKATPPWLTEQQIKAMQDMYVNRPKGFEVDHIVPLRGKDVCGLHVPWNLQYLPISENRKKSNKITR
jgi:5-methylcytosine-specific restriction endonuclease McrA